MCCELVIACCLVSVARRPHVHVHAFLTVLTVRTQSVVLTARKANLTCDTRVLFFLSNTMNPGETVAPKTHCVNSGLPIPPNTAGASIQALRLAPKQVE